MYSLLKLKETRNKLRFPKTSGINFFTFLLPSYGRTYLHASYIFLLSLTELKSEAKPQSNKNPSDHRMSIRPSVRPYTDIYIRVREIWHRLNGIHFR